MEDDAAQIWPMVRGDPTEEYEFGHEIQTLVVPLCGGVTIPQKLFRVTQRVEMGVSSPLPLFAKVYTIENDEQSAAIVQHVRIWAGVDLVDRPGSGKMKKCFVETVLVSIPQVGVSGGEGGAGASADEASSGMNSTSTFSSSSSSAATTTTTTSSSSSTTAATDAFTTTTTSNTGPRVRVTIIQEGSPEAPIELGRGFENCYTYFKDKFIARGGNAGGVKSNNSFGGVFRGEAIDYAKPLPSLAIKRLDGRDSLKTPRVSWTKTNINNADGAEKLYKEVSTWASLHYPTPHPRVVRIFDAFLDEAPAPHSDLKIASIVMESAPPGDIIDPESLAAAIKAHQALVGAGGGGGNGSGNGNSAPLNTSALKRISRPTDLVDFVIRSKSALTHWQSIHVMTQVLMTLFHMHNRVPQIVHRDIKGDNIILWDIKDAVTLYRLNPATGEEEVLVPSTSLYLVKLADFGEARFLRPEEEAWSEVGTLAYKASEVGNGPQTPAVDVYSCGITLFTLMMAAAPFGIDYDKSLGCSLSKWLANVRGGAATLSSSPYYERFKSDLTPEAQNAILRMMNPYPTDRITIPELFAHPLFAEARGVYYKVGKGDQVRNVPLVPNWRM